MIEVHTGTINFPSRNGFGPQQDDENVVCSKEYRKFAVFLSGYQIQFDGGDDHHIGLANVDVKGVAVNATTINVAVTMGLRDWSGDWDDHYSGSVSYTVIAEM